MVKTAWLAAALGLAAVLGAGPAAAQDTMAEVKKKGTLVVGVKADYPPWGMRDPAGNVVGMEIDMAMDVAKRLGVKAEIVAVLSSNRMQFLQQGKIDLMIATMSVNDERKKVVGIVEPYYYASGVAMMAKKSANLKSLADVKGKQVCALQGAYYNKDIASKYVGGDLVAFKSVPENDQALLDGRCVGFVYDDVIIIYKKASEADKWKDHDVVALPEIEALPWGIAVRIEERDGAWGKYVSEVIKDWHKTGALLALEKKWLGANTPWLVDMNKRMKAGS